MRSALGFGGATSPAFIEDSGPGICLKAAPTRCQPCKIKGSPFPKDLVETSMLPRQKRTLED